MIKLSMFKKYALTVNEDIFYFSLIGWVLFFALDLIRPGFSANYINLNYILILAIITGIIKTMAGGKRSNSMIDGVKIKKIARYSDDRGFFSEIIKSGEETFHEVKQTSYTETYPGVIKAFHWHKKQWDVWFVVRGMAQVVLHDMRKDSPTKDQTQVIYAGEDDPVLIAIPPYVAHGYRVLGKEKVCLFYHTSEAYDPADPDEERIAFDDPRIGFDWSTRNR